MIAVMTFACLLTLSAGRPGSLPLQETKSVDPYARFLFPMCRALPAPEVTIDVTDAPELRTWAEDAKQLIHDWFPLLTPILATEHYRPPHTLKLTLKKGISAPAYTAGNEITASVSWVQAHPDDFGMIIHELTHVIQAYPGGGNKPGWLVEGIADYVRWWRYEASPYHTRIDPQRASYKDSYRTTAAFLAWIVANHNRAIVHDLDQALRDGTYTDAIFRTDTGKTVDELWSDFVKIIRPS